MTTHSEAFWAEDVQAHFLVSGADPEGFRANISVVRWPHESPSLEQLADGAIPEGLDSVLVLAERSVEAPEPRYFERVYRFIEPKESLLVQQLQRCMLVRGRPVVLTYTHLADRFDEGLSYLDEVFRNVQQVGSSTEV